MSRAPEEPDNGRATVRDIYNGLDRCISNVWEFGVGAQFLYYTIANGTRTANVAVPDHGADHLEKRSVIQ